MGESYGNLQIFTGNANPRLAQAISDNMGIPLADVVANRFSDGEIRVIIEENVRGTDSFVIQSTCLPVNDSLMELLIIIDALRRASARRITAVIPYYGYGRQDRKTRGREPITAKLVANLLAQAGAGRILTVDLHAGQIQGFFDIPVDHLTGIGTLATHFGTLDSSDMVVVAPDTGAVARARDMANRLKATIAIVDKHRPEAGVAHALHVIGDVTGKTALLLDEMIDTAGTICAAAKALRKHGARRVLAAATHGVLSAPALQRLADAPIEKVVLTDTIPVDEHQLDKIRVLSVAPLLGEAIRRIHEDRSVSDLFASATEDV